MASWLVLILATAVTAPLAAQSARDPWTAIYAHRDSFPAMTYTVAFRMKMFDKADTLPVKARIHLVKKPGDGLFGGLVLIDLDSTWTGYDGRHILHANRKDSTLMMVDPVLHPGAYIKTTIYDNLLEKSFFTGRWPLRDLAGDTTLAIRHTDTVFSGLPTRILHIGFPPSDGFSGEFMSVMINPGANYITHRTHSVSFQENEQYTSWIFSDVCFSADTLIAQFSPAALAGYRILRDDIPLSRPNSNIGDSLQINPAAVEGHELFSGKPFSLGEVPGRLILLDFWYSACYPCIKAIPHINALFRQYKDQGLEVFGMNPVDDDGKARIRLEKFMRNNPMDYPAVMLSGRARQWWNGLAFPTIMLLDPAGKILFRTSGFSEKLTDMLSTEIEKYLSQ